MGRFFLLTFLALSVNQAQAESLFVRPVFPSECILQTVADRMNITLTEDIEVPEVHYESETSLSFFQEAMAGQWNFDVDTILNAYSFAKNIVFVMDDSAFYQRMKRFIDDSIAHEYVHYFQVKYQGQNPLPEFAEFEAIQIQTWFREKVFVEQSLNPCD